MTTREYLAAIIARHLDPVATRRSDPAGAIADAILAAGFKHPQDVAAQAKAALAAQREGIAAVLEAEGHLRCPIHGIPDCSPLLNGCSVPNYIRNTLALAATAARTYTQEAGE